MNYYKCTFSEDSEEYMLYSNRELILRTADKTLKNKFIAAYSQLLD